jgi:hypothetical protein
MTTGATGQLGLALPVQGELSGTWGDTVNNGITQYTNIAIAATLTLTGDGAVTLANTTGDASASNITSTLAGAGTVTAQFAIVRVTGTLTTAKVITAPSYSKTYVVVNAATGGIVTFKASGQTGVSVAVGESAFVYYNGTDYVKLATTTYGVGDVVGPASATANGIALFNSTTGKLIKDSAASDGLIYGLTVGRGAGAVATNTAVGASALNANTTGADSVAIGYNAANKTTTGNAVVAVGGYALYNNTTGTANTAVGSDYIGTALGALENNTTGSFNIGVGTGALGSNTTASNNTAVGYQAGYSNTTGTEITAVGKGALYANTTGNTNSAFGLNALTTNTTGADNSGLGAEALRFNTTGNSNTAIGKAALSANTTASNNTAVGYQAGYVSTGQANTFYGSSSGLAATGANNSYIGTNSGYLMTTGFKNTILGSFSGNQGGLDIRTASSYIVLSDGDGNPRQVINNSGALSFNITTPTYGTSGQVLTSAGSGAAPTWTTPSAGGSTSIGLVRAIAINCILC